MQNLSRPLIQLDQVSLTSVHGLHHLLSNLSCEIFTGDRIGLVGASGAGKTSLLRLLNRLSEPTSGAIYLEGQKLSQIPVVNLRQRIVLVLQEPKLLGMKIRDALIYPLQLRQLPPSLIQERLQKWLAQLEIPDSWLERTELELSVGQRQWVALARALITEPDILLLDEPTSALDIGKAEQLLQALDQPALTTVLVSHQLELIQRFSRRVLYLDQGSLVQEGETVAFQWHQLRERLQQKEQQAATEWG